MNYFFCVDIGGTSMKYSVVTMEGEMVFKHIIDTDAFLGGPHLVEKVKELVTISLQTFPLEGICISTAGMVDDEKGEIIYAGRQIPNYKGTKWKEILEETFHLPCEVENDVNCAGLCESYVGAGKESNRSVCITVGTGVGGCFMLNKKIFHGFSNSACEIGYMDIGGTPFQDLASTSALVKRVAKKKQLEEINGKLIFHMAKQGDLDCIEEIHTMIDALTTGIASICYVLNPEIVILGGGIMGQKEYLEEKIKNQLKGKMIELLYKNTKLAFAHHENEAGMLGAFYHFKEKQGLS